MQNPKVSSQLSSRRSSQPALKRHDPGATITVNSRHRAPMNACMDPFSAQDNARTARGPPRMNTDWMVDTLTVAAQTQMPMRTGNDRSMPVRITTMKAPTHTAANAPPRSDGLNSIRFEDGAAQGGLAWVAGNIAGDEITRQVRVGQFEKLRKGRAFVVARP